MKEILPIAMTFFFIADPLGNSPVLLSLVKRFPLKKKRQILFRESLFALAVAFFFQYLGQPFLNLLQIDDSTITIAGGILIFLVSLEMLFPPPIVQGKELKKEPFFVPIAVPLISGPGILTVIMLYSSQDKSPWQISLAILLAWMGITFFLVCAPFLQKILKEKGLNTLERLMGLIVCLISTNMIIEGIKLFAKGAQ